MASRDDRRAGLAFKLMLIGAGLVLAMFAFAACGGDDEGEETDTAATETTEATDATDTAAEEEGDGAGEGEALFVDTGCGSCHTLAAAGTSGNVGPDLDEVAAGMSAADIRNSIVNPDDEITEGFSPGVMPQDYGEQLSGQELDALAQYIADNAGS